MRKIKAFLVMCFLCCVQAHYGQYTEVINSNRPGKSMSAFSVGKTVFQVEGGVYGITQEHNISDYTVNGFGTDFNIRYGEFWEQLEFNLETQFQYDWYQAALVDETRSGFRQFTLGAKYLVYDPYLKRKPKKPNFYSWKANHTPQFQWSDLVPCVAIYGGLNFKIGDTPYTFAEDEDVSPKLMLITQNMLGDRWVLVGNFILDKLTTDKPSFGVIGTLTHGFNMRWSAFAEVQAYSSDYYSDTVLRGGAAYLVWENLQLDASISTNFKDTPSILYGGIGASWRFDANYETDYQRIKPEKKKEDKKDKKKKGKKQKTQDELDNYKP